MQKSSATSKRVLRGRKKFNFGSYMFFSIGIILLIDAIDIILQTGWLLYLAIGVAIVAIVYAIVSSIMIEKRKK